jgi:hypothetical protein
MGMTCACRVDLAIRQEQRSHRLEGGGPMARRTFDVIDISEILIHWHAGRSQNQISASLGVDRRTIRKYTAAAGVVFASLFSTGYQVWYVYHL